MTKGRWTITPETAALEAYAIFIRKERVGRAYSKEHLLNELRKREAYEPFLKLCLEYDDSLMLRHFRSGLLYVIRAIGPERFAKLSGLHRVSLYRMLSAEGNPRLEGFMRVLKALEINVWIVDRDFMARRGRFIRPKDQKPERVFVESGGQVRARKNKF
jgi:probable addiction module antidote protein